MQTLFFWEKTPEQTVTNHGSLHNKGSMDMAIGSATDQGQWDTITNDGSLRLG
jgi:hypothetical protein